VAQTACACANKSGAATEDRPYRFLGNSFHTFAGCERGARMNIWQMKKREYCRGRLLVRAGRFIGVHLLGSCLLAGQAPASASVHCRYLTQQRSTEDKTDLRPLDAEKPVVRELAAGGIHAYSIALAAGQFIHIAVEQKGINVALTLLAPDGAK